MEPLSSSSDSSKFLMRHEEGPVETSVLLPHWLLLVLSETGVLRSSKESPQEEQDDHSRVVIVRTQLWKLLPRLDIRLLPLLLAARVWVE